MKHRRVSDVIGIYVATKMGLGWANSIRLDYSCPTRLDDLRSTYKVTHDYYRSINISTKKAMNL